MHERQKGGLLHCGDKEQCRLGISQGFPELWPFPSIVGCDSLVLPDSFNCNLPLMLIQPPGVTLVIWHEVHENQ